GPTRVTFHTRQIGLYAQDRWSPTHALTLTAGLRIDVTFLPDAVATNASLKAALGIDTGMLPSGALLWSPRLGFNSDLGGEGRTFIRGGIGLFSGRPPYAWVGSAYRDDGTHSSFLSCDGGEVPSFDPLNQPITCASGVQATPQVTVFDPRLSFPQNQKGALAADHRLPAGIAGTVDVVCLRAGQARDFTAANLGPPEG